MPTCGGERCASPGAVGPASRLRRRDADAPAAARLTGLGAAELTAAHGMATDRAAVIPWPASGMAI